VITVLDTGTGISKKEQKKLFKMFGCLQSTQQMNTQGIGLGLFICKQIVEQFEGDIFVKSQVGKGTRFTFSFLLDQRIESF
jgi:signal transduction histidine kinase